MLDAQPTGRNEHAGVVETLARMRYGERSGTTFLSGIQAVARLSIDQRRLDIRAGRDTAGFVSGYRGSPLGGLDSELWRQAALLQELGVVFQPGVNEDLAATSVWGTQQVGLFPGAKHEGVFGLWYGKAPGLDRSSDALRHANAAGTSPLGGVLLVVGDDPGCKSSTLPSASEFALRDLGIPVLAPANVQEVLDFGLFGWALSRYAGCWAGLLAVTDVMDSAMTVDIDLARHAFALPRHKEAESPHIRLDDSPLEQEARLEWKLRLVTAFAAANGIDQLITDPAQPRLVVVSAGKVYTDVREAFAKLGLGTSAAIAAAGVRLVKLGMTWPLNTPFLEHACRGAGRVLVVEQKRAFIEEQLRSLLFGTRDVEVLGKQRADGSGAPIALPAIGELDAHAIATTLAAALCAHGSAQSGAAPIDNTYLTEVRAARATLSDAQLDAKEARLPVYCPGCPHNISTRVPTGARASAGIGCHYMAQWMGRNTHLTTHMGAEGVNWIGQAPFTDEPHIFVNLGDGTYFHSGLLAIRAAVAAGVHVTYKILANDAVAMTGGQPVDGELAVSDIVAQVRAEGVADVRLVADDPRRHRRRGWPWRRRGLCAAPREALDAVQRELRATPGCTVLVYDQTCAAELRRRRRRGLAPDPDVRVVINDAVCEGCGDCSVQSSCAAIDPLPTELGVKRAINQTACNKDLSCLAGFCPAMVTVRGARPKRGTAGNVDALRARLPSPARPSAANILIAGVGGTGVVTVSQLLGTAAHLDGKFVSTLDATGLAQKGGAVVSHVRVSEADAPHAPTRVAQTSADVLIAADQVTAAGRDVLALLSPHRTLAVVNDHTVPTAAFVLAGGDSGNGPPHAQHIRAHVRQTMTVDAQASTKAHFGVATCANVFLLGCAFQRGTLPVTLEALEKAIELNGVEVADNLAAFHLGRAAALDGTAAAHEPSVPNAPPQAMLPPVSHSLDERIAYRRSFLVAYQNEALASKYEALVRRTRAAEQRVRPASTALTEAVTDGYFRLLAVKDEYEVARLFVSGDAGFDQHLATHFTGRWRTTYHFAPSWFGRCDARGRTRKIALPGWLVRPVLRVLASLRMLRGGVFDVFQHTAERKLERLLLARFEADFQQLGSRLTDANFNDALALARLPAGVKGFGPVKETAARAVLLRRERLAEELFAAPAEGENAGAAASRQHLPTAA